MQLSRFLLPAVLAIGLGVACLAPTVAQAHEVVHRRAHEVVRHEVVRHDVHYYRTHYDVLYRCGLNEAWRCSGRFDSRAAARCAADGLARAGNFVRISAVR
jgi:hypothetical protein